MRRYWKLKQEALYYTLWRTRFGRSYGLDLRRTVMITSKNEGPAPMKITNSKLTISEI